MNIKPFMVLAALATIICSCDRKEVDKLYYESGELKKMVPYENGKVDGMVKIFYKNGELKKKGPYKNGKAHGEAKTFYKDGTLKTIEQWRNDKLHGKGKAFYSNGSLKLVSLYKNDSPKFAQAFKKDGSFKRQRRDVDVSLSDDTVTVGERLTINTRLYGRLKLFDSVNFGIAPYDITYRYPIDTFRTKDTVIYDTTQFWGRGAKGEIKTELDTIPGNPFKVEITTFEISGNKKYDNGFIPYWDTLKDKTLQKKGTKKRYQFQYTPTDTGFHCFIGFYRLYPKDPSFQKLLQYYAFPVQFYVKEKPERAM